MNECYIICQSNTQAQILRRYLIDIGFEDLPINEERRYGSASIIIIYDTKEFGIYSHFGAHEILLYTVNDKEDYKKAAEEIKNRFDSLMSN